MWDVNFASTKVLLGVGWERENEKMKRLLQHKDCQLQGNN